MATFSIVTDSTTFMEAWAAFGATTPAIGSVFHIRIALSRVVSAAGSELAVRPDSVEEKPLAVGDLRVVERPAAVEMSVVERLLAEETRGARSLQPSAAVIVPLVEFKTAARRGWKAITDSPA